MTFGQFFMFHDFSMTIFIFQVFQSPWEPRSKVLQAGWGGELQVTANNTSPDHLSQHTAPPTSHLPHCETANSVQHSGVSHFLLHSESF